jgi:hypothetical protein
MAQKRITELTEDTAPTANDVVPVTDVETNTTKKVKLSNLSQGMGDVVHKTGDETIGGTKTFSLSAIFTQGFNAFFGLFSGGNAIGSNSNKQIQFDYNGGGYSHYITTEHNSNTNLNKIKVWLNESLTANGSSAPGVGNRAVLELENTYAKISNHSRTFCFRADSIEESSVDDDTDLVINYAGYNGGYTRKRGLNIFNGLGVLIANFNRNTLGLNISGPIVAANYNVVSGQKNAGDYIELDGIRLTMSSSGNRSFGIMTASGSVVVDGTTRAIDHTGTNLFSSFASVTVSTSFVYFNSAWSMGAVGNVQEAVFYNNTNGHFYKATGIVGPSYTPCRLRLERLD